MTDNKKKTPLFEEHLRLGARMVEFAGWVMPIQYKGLIEEHNSVRNHVGLFDVSHMGEIRVRGPLALSTLEWLTTNDVGSLESGYAQYSLLPNNQGGLVDDVIVYCLKKNEDYLVCVNASNKDKDFDWMIKNNKGAEILDESARWAQIAIQGPKACALCEDLLKIKLSEIKPFRIESGKFREFDILVATTGYTGEKGCEVFIENRGAVDLWKLLLEKGQKYEVQPVGLGARDTLRTEMKYSLYGHEIDDHRSPYEAGLGWVIKPLKKDFLNKGQLVSYKERGLKQSLVGFEMLERGIPRQGYGLFSFDRKPIGKVTSGTHSPSLEKPIGIGFVDIEFSQEGTEFLVDIRGRMVKAAVCKTPFIKK